MSHSTSQLSNCGILGRHVGLVLDIDVQDNPIAHVHESAELGDDGAGRIREAYPGTTWDRLVEVKRRYDPDNVFHLNHNIKS